MQQFFKFGIVGVVGFIVDAGVLALCMKVGGLGPYEGRLVSFLIAVTVTWLGNRHFTFKEKPTPAATHASPVTPTATTATKQWFQFLIVCLGGFALNYGTYAALMATCPLVAAWPTLGVAAGSLAGMFFNFFTSKNFVFRKR